MRARMNGTWWEAPGVSLTVTIASMLFAAAAMGCFRARCNWMEIALLLGACFLLFRSDAVAGMYYPMHTLLPAVLLVVLIWFVQGKRVLGGGGRYLA